MRLPTSRVAACAALALALGACVAGEDDLTLDTSADEEAAPPSVSWEEFRAGVEQEPWEGGAFIVDGDIAIHGEEKLRAFYDAWVAQERAAARGALTVSNKGGVDKIWASTRGHMLTYCVSNTFGAKKAQVVNAMRLAAESWSNLVSVQYRYRPDQDASCTASNNNVLFDVRPVDGVSYLARAFFTDDVRADRNVLIAPDAFTATGGGVDFQGILAHELGHTIGFRHEHIHIACTTEDADDSRQVTSYDVNSVMHYPQCRPSGGGGLRQTKLDYRGAILLYGLSAPLITTTVIQ